MLHEYHVIYSVLYYVRFHVTTVGLGTYDPQIGWYCCVWKRMTADKEGLLVKTGRVVKTNELR
jgi:hypothetical protein